MLIADWSFHEEEKTVNLKYIQDKHTLFSYYFPYVEVMMRKLQNSVHFLISYSFLVNVADIKCILQLNLTW